MKAQLSAIGSSVLLTTFLFYLFKSTFDNFMEQFDSSGNLLSRLSLLILSKPSALDDVCKSFDVFWQYHRIVEQFLVAVITEDSSLTFVAPRALLEYFFSLGASAVLRASEEPFWDMVMFRRV